MDRSLLRALEGWLCRPDVSVHDPERLAALRDALGDADPPVTAGRWGALMGYEPRSRRRLVQFDRRGRLTAALTWSAHGALVRAKCMTAWGEWIGIEPAAAEHPGWGRSDRLCRLDPDRPWRPSEALTLFQSLDWARPDFIPPLAEPRRLPPGAGTAVLNLLAGLMKDQGLTDVRYRGPYPTEQLFTALLECFRYDPVVTSPLERFLDGGDLRWTPAPHEHHHVAPGVCVQLRHEVDKVVLHGAAFYRPDWQGVVRREPRRVRQDGERYVCSLWALGRSLEDRLVLDRWGEVLDTPLPEADLTPAVPLPPVWNSALGDLIARESAPALGPAIRQVMARSALEWGPVAGDLSRVTGRTLRVSSRLRAAGLSSVRSAPPGAERLEQAVALALEVARLLAPAVREQAQARVEAMPEDEQRRLLESAEAATGPRLGPAVGRLLALVASGAA